MRVGRSSADEMLTGRGGGRSSADDMLTLARKGWLGGGGRSSGDEMLTLVTNKQKRGWVGG